LFTNEQSNDYIRKLPDQYPYEFPGETVYFSRLGKYGIDAVNADLSNFVFGGFAHGSYRHDFPDDIKVVSLSNLPLDLWTSLSMVLNRILQQKNS
jgi:rRNA pseudouridine-1189 N-methylase Emg1 (Nep1/Mra1 family)